MAMMLRTGPRNREAMLMNLGVVPDFTSRAQEKHARWCFLAVSFSMLLNFFMAFLNTHGVGMNESKVTIIQILVTALCGCLLLTRHTTFRPMPIIMLGLLLVQLIVMNLLKTPNARAFYDCMILPLYIGIGASAYNVRDRWMSWLFWFVFAVCVMEALLPSVYGAIVNAGDYFKATRSWVANAQANQASQDGLYAGAYRGGGTAAFALIDHRAGGPFLEPLSLGYFSVLMTIYFAGMHRGGFLYRVIAVAACLFLSMLSDSRAASGLLLLCAPLLFARLRLPALLMWLASPALLFVAWFYYSHHADDGSDLYYRISLTFNGLAGSSAWEMLMGNVNTEHANDSGLLSLTYNFGLIGVFLAIFYYSGLFTRRTGSNPSLFICFSLLATLTLMFGAALLSIKSASLMGFLVGLAGRPPADVAQDDEDAEDLPQPLPIRRRPAKMLA